MKALPRSRGESIAALDGLMEKIARQVARRSSRRGFLARCGALLAGTAAFPLLPIARAAQPAQQPSQEGERSTSPPSPEQCEYWRYCAIDGFLCTCCGGSFNSCPPGTEPSPITWIGTCMNSEDGKRYVISYNDCCGKSACGRCMCNRNEGDRPVYRASEANDINWCLGTTDGVVYNCSTAVVLGTADDETDSP